MRAIVQDELGGPDVLHLRDIPRPAPGIGEVLVEIRATSVNPAEVLDRESGLFSGSTPFTPGWDVSGVVAEVGFGVTLFRPGDEVFGLLPFPRGGGSYAEYAVAPTRAFVPKPDELTHKEAGVLPLAGLTAWQALVETAGLGEGSHVLITGAAGGVGHLAVQIAHARGAHITAVGSAGQEGFLRDLGADEFIDYHAADFTEIAHDLDVVFDLVGNDYPQRAISTVKKGGMVVTTLPQSVPAAIPAAQQAGVRITALFVESDRMDLTALVDLVHRDALRPTVVAEYRLSDAAIAQSTKHGPGKVAIVVN